VSVINSAGLSAVWRRQLGSLLGNPLGYIFILAFVIGASAFLFLQDDFYARNICDLGPLWSNEGKLPPFMPLLLAILLPALAMGAWASEREQGTEEVLLTMPLTPLDALLGKYFAVASYFSIALLCSLSIVCMLAWLGKPDFGLIFATYVGWWLAGLAFAALGLLASVMVGMPAIAFVLGAVFCSVAMYGAVVLDWFGPFNRGLISVGGIVVALATIGTGLGLALLLLASRRWRPGAEGLVTANILSLVFGVIIAINLAHTADRHGANLDVSAEGLSSLGAESKRILAGLERPVTITAFISTDLPSELQPKRKQIEDKLEALRRSAGAQVKVEIFRPVDSLDEYALLATRDFGLKTRQELVDTVTGKEYSDVFLSAAVSSGGSTQLIEYFDPGLSVEYEIMRAVRTVGMNKKRVLGIAATDLEINSGFDMRSMQMRPAWQMIEEWKHQYDVRDVNLDGPVDTAIEVLVVAQPSSLTDAQLTNLHDYIWNGGPTLLMEDPMPIFSGGPALAISQPKKNDNPYGGPSEGPKKGEIRPLFKALGIDFDPNIVTWSKFSPSHEFKDRLTENFVMIRRDQGGVFDSPDTAGVDSLMLPFPGLIREASDKASGLTVSPLVRPIAGAPWGQHTFQDHVQSSPFGGPPQPKKVTRFTPGNPDRLPWLAVDITGTMPSVYPKPDPQAKAEAKEGEAAGPPAMKTGVSSPKPVHVIVIADTDFANDAFFQFYRNPSNNFSKDELKFLLDLKNVQFVSNAVDALAADQDFVKLRARKVMNRPLAKLEEVVLETERKRADDSERVASEAEAKIERANIDFQANIARIQNEEGLDEESKKHRAEQARAIGQRNLEIDIQKIKRDQENNERAFKVEQRRKIATYRERLRFMSVGIPAVVLAALVLVVFLNRLNRERSHVPASRKRSVV
jgi:ABC-2 type transport system permease protein